MICRTMSASRPNENRRPRWPAAADGRLDLGYARVAAIPTTVNAGEPVSPDRARARRSKRYPMTGAARTALPRRNTSHRPPDCFEEKKMNRKKEPTRRSPRRCATPLADLIDARLFAPFGAQSLFAGGAATVAAPAALRRDAAADPRRCGFAQAPHNIEMYHQAAPGIAPTC